MRKRSGWLLITLLFLLLKQASLHAQTITIDNANFNTTAKYGAGGSITVPIKISGCFTPDEKFELYLSDVNGNFPGKLIGGYNLFFTPFVNGIIPAGSSGANYKLKVVAKNSGVFAVTPTFAIAGSGTIIGNLQEANGNARNDSTYGICPVPASPDSMQLALKDPSLSTESLNIISSTGTATLATSLGSSRFAFYAHKNNYYTAQALVKDGLGNVVSSKSFLILFSATNGGLQTAGKIEICLPASVEFSVNYNSAGGIQQNYPSTIYTVNWGDSTAITKLSQCALINQNGKLNHSYDTTSCGQPPIIGKLDTVNNAFLVQINASNDFCPTNFAGTNSSAKVFKRPKPQIDGYAINCYTDTITLCGNNSNPGSAAPNNAALCGSGGLLYSWYINQPTPTFPDSKDSCFLAILARGKNSVTLVVANDGDNNPSCTADTTVIFCVEAKPNPAFKVGGQDTLTTCNPTVKITNQTNSSICGTNIYQWYVTDSSDINILSPSPTTYTIDHDSIPQPTFVFKMPGTYHIHMYIQNSCAGGFSAERIVNLVGVASVTLPGTQKYCGLKTIDFATDTKHQPKYNSNQGGEKYFWTVTGGDYSFVGGTTSKSAFPQIQFKDYTTYTIKDSFVNNCGIASASQIIVFNQGLSVLANAGTHDTTVCYSSSTLQLNGSVAGTADSTKWFTSGTGTFSDRKILAPVYTFTTADKNSDTIKITLDAYDKTTSACPIVSDTLNVIIKPRNGAADTVLTICSGGINYSPSSSIAGSTYTWASTVTSGQVTGNKATGADTIKDVLVNKSQTNIGSVQYTITPFYDGCKGQPYKLSAVIYPSPVTKVNKTRDSICSGGAVNIRVYDSVHNSGFTYSIIAPATVSGYVDQTSPIDADTLTITDKLVNNGATDTTVMYIVTAFGQRPTRCTGTTDTVRIVVRAGATAANAGNDIALCNDSVTALAGNEPGLGETGLWTKVQGPAGAAIVTPLKGSTQVTGLKAGIYLFQWHINSLTCLSSSDTVMVTNTAAVNNKVPDTSVSICKGSTVNIPAPQAGGGDGTYTYQWQQSPDNSNWSDIPGQDGASLSFIPDATVYIKRIVTSGYCSVDSKTILITVKPTVNNNTIAANQSVCINNNADTIRGTVPTGGDGTYTYSWQQSPDGINYAAIPGEAGKDYYPGIIDATTYYLRVVNSSLCGALQGGPSSNPVVIILHKNAVADFAASSVKGCTPFQLKDVITNNDHPDVNGNYNWYANNVLIGSGVNFPGYSITNSADSVSIKLEALSGFGCLSDNLSIKFYSYAKPVTTFGLSDSAGCGPLTVSFTNTTANRDLFQFTWNFGNGATSQANDTVSTVFLPNPTYYDTVYKVTLSAVTVCDDVQYEKDILVRSKPKASFTPDSSFNCSPREVVFTNNSAGNNVTYSWNFGDGSPEQANNNDTVHHTFHTGAAVLFKVRLIATNNCGGDTAYFNISVNPNTIDLHFSEDVDQKFGCTGQSVTFINNTKGADIFNWNFGDPNSGNNNTLTTTSGIGTVTHIYNSAGSYIITLCAANGCTQDTCTTETIAIKQTPNAAFDYPAEICVGDTASLTNRSQPNDGSLGYAWYFGDGAIDSTTVNPQHIYALAGKDTVILIAKADFPLGFSCRDTAQHAIVVNGPTGEFNYPATVCLGGPLTFTAVSSNTDKYQFYFGDGESSGPASNPVISHTYRLPGKYIPYVVLITGNCSKQIQGVDTIYVDSVKAAFTYSLISYCDSTAVQFTDGSFSSFGIKKWTWLLGDGTIAAGPGQMHTYKASNNYPVTLSVETVNGCTDSILVNLPLHVKNRPAFSIENNLTGCIAQPVIYTAVGVSADSVNFYGWTFSNGLSLNGANVTNYYASAGTDTATLITGTTEGCYDTATSIVTINPSPAVKAGSDQLICKGQAVQLTSTADVSPLTWSPVDSSLSCAVCGTPLAAPVKTTRYTVSGTNTFGCTTSDTVLVTVVQPIHISITGDTLLCIGDSTRLFAHGTTQYNWSPATGIADGITNAPSALFRPVITTQYRVIGNDDNNCFYDTAYVTVAVGNYPTVGLGADQVQSTGTLLPLKSSVTNGPIVKWLWQPSTDLDCDTCAVPVAHIKQNICYTVTATNNYECAASDTLCITVFCLSGQVFIPNAFTPDNDGKNDILMVRAKGVKTVKSFRIFSRWGQVVFEKSNFAPNDPQYGWDGKINGKISQPDVFVYTCEVECEDGTKFTYKGNTSVLK